MQRPRLMLATLVDEPFDDEGWIFETKWDGVRALCRVDRRARLTLVSRTGQDLTRTFPDLAPLADAFTGTPVAVDGEIVALDARGVSSFQRLQERLNRTQPSEKDVEAVRATFVAFDLLEHRGRDVTALPVERRRALLESSMHAMGDLVAYSRSVRGKGRAVFAAAQRAGLEGIMAKRLGSRYVARRSRDWLKIKTHKSQEFVVLGWTEPRGSRAELGSLLLGVYQGQALEYVGAVGTGFDGPTLADLGRRLRAIERASAPLARAPRRASAAHWVTPKLVAEVRFAEWTRGGSIRQPVFLGLRSDKRPRDVVREEPAALRGRKPS